MRLGILSDTHDQLTRTSRAVQQLCDSGAEALVHCGDLTGPAILEACALRPCWFVLGNNDGDAAAELKLAAEATGATSLGWGGVFEFDGKRFAVTHGHLFGQLRSLTAERPDFLLSGHTHLAIDDDDGDVRRINPGALHSASEYTVALLNTADGRLQFLHVER